LSQNPILDYVSLAAFFRYGMQNNGQYPLVLIFREKDFNVNWESNPGPHSAEKVGSHTIT
jgi:hypothetical protein